MYTIEQMKLRLIDIGLEIYDLNREIDDLELERNDLMNELEKDRELHGD